MEMLNRQMGWPYDSFDCLLFQLNAYFNKFSNHSDWPVESISGVIFLYAWASRSDRSHISTCGKTAKYSIYSISEC